MKTFTTIILVLLFTLNLNAQEGVRKEKAKDSFKQVQPDLKKEALKKQLKAPNRNDYKSEEDYLKAKEKWIKSNPDKYQKILKKKEDSVE